jgi:phosphoglycerate dehydrogenase-like enzyme
MPLGNSSTRPLRVLVIGAGPAAAALHLPVLARLQQQGRIVLAVVCDLRPERAAAARRQFGFLEESGDGLAALARPDLDAAYVFADARLHYEYGLAALRNGKHLFVEKPVAPSFLQAQEMAHVAAAGGLSAVGGHNRRFYPSLLRVRAAAGTAGWRYAEAVFHKPEAGKSPPFGARTWLSANGIHALDALLYLMGGLPERVMAMAAAPGATQADTFAALLAWRDGRQGIFLCDNAAGARREEYAFHAVGESYTVTDAGLTIARGETLETEALPAIGAGLLPEHEAFLQAIASGAQAPHSIGALAPSLFMCELIEAGYCGAVRLPEAQHSSGPAPGATPLPRMPAQPAARSILVAQPAALQQALSRRLPGWRLVSVADVVAGPAARPDIEAALLGRGAQPLAPEILAKLPNLAIVGVAGLSLAAYAPAALLARNVALVNASEAYAQSLAEFALALAILARRRGFTSHEAMRRGGWGTAAPVPGLRGELRRAARKLRPLASGGLESRLRRLWRAAQPLLGTEAPAPQARLLQGASIGLIGWGASARAFAARLTQAQARVLVYTEHATEAELRAAGAVPGALGEVLAADIVSLHRGLTAATRHFLGAAELARLRPGAVLINVARGALIEPEALLARLRRGDVFACLDTFEAEPLAPNDPLRALPNVFLTSHVGGGSADMHAAAADEVVAKVAAYLRGEPVETLSAERLASMT